MDNDTSAGPAGLPAPVVTFRDAVEADAVAIGVRLCASDAAEAWKANRHGPLEAVVGSFRDTMLAFGPCITCLVDGVPELMCGVKLLDGPLSERGAIWMLRTDVPTQWPTLFGRYSKKILSRLFARSGCTVLENWVHIDNAASIRWLNFLGACFDRECRGEWRHFVLRNDTGSARS